MRKIISLLITIVFLSGCNRAGISPISTSVPENHVLTVVAETMAALPSSTPAPLLPTATVAPTNTPTLPPTVTPTSISTALPEVPRPAIQVLSPGTLSKVVSPIVLKSYIRPGADGLIQVELLGEDGRLLAREILRRESVLAEGAYVSIEIPFETRAAAELGRLQISTKDDLDRPLEKESIHLLLLSVGDNDINLGAAPYARAAFFYPRSKTEIFGGTLPIIGEIQAYNDNPVILDLLDDEGKTLGTRTLSFTAGSREEFETTIEYDVDEQAEARLVIRQADEKFEGSVYLHSQIVVINP